MLTRREFTKWGAGSVAALLLGAGCSESPKKPSLTDIATDLSASGFEVDGPHTTGKAEREVIYVCDTHTFEYRDSVKPLMDILIGRYKLPVGRESHWLPQEQEEKEGKEIDAFFSELAALIEKAPYFSSKKYKSKSFDGGVEGDLEANLRELYSKTTTWGLEDTELFFKWAACIQYGRIYNGLMNNAMGPEFDNDPKKEENLLDYLGIMQKLCSGMTLPLAVGVRSQREISVREKIFEYKFTMLTLQQRTESYAKNIPGRMDAAKLKRSAVIVGEGHLRKIEIPDYTNEKVTVHNPLQERFDHSYITVKPKAATVKNSTS